MIKATINKVEIEVPEGTTILEAARSANFAIPTLCRHPDLPAEGSLRHMRGRGGGFSDLEEGLSHSTGERMGGEYQHRPCEERPQRACRD